MQHTNKQALMGFRSDVATAWGAAPKRSDYVTIVCTFAFARPKSHYLPANSKRPEPVLRIDAPVAHIKPPDIDKLLRAVLDALTGRAYDDDAQVIDVVAMKVWSRDGSTTIEVRP
jgi:Holliday junction resolvase RusA-like endonuclease